MYIYGMCGCIDKCPHSIYSSICIYIYGMCGCLYTCVYTQIHLSITTCLFSSCASIAMDSHHMCLSHSSIYMVCVGVYIHVCIHKFICLLLRVYSHHMRLSLCALITCVCHILRYVYTSICHIELCIHIEE